MLEAVIVKEQSFRKRDSYDMEEAKWIYLQDWKNSD